MLTLLSLHSKTVAILLCSHGHNVILMILTWRNVVARCLQLQVPADIYTRIEFEFEFECKGKRKSPTFVLASKQSWSVD